MASLDSSLQRPGLATYHKRKRAPYGRGKLCKDISVSGERIAGLLSSTLDEMQAASDGSSGILSMEQRMTPKGNVRGWFMNATPVPILNPVR